MKLDYNTFTVNIGQHHRTIIDIIHHLSEFHCKD